MGGWVGGFCKSIVVMAKVKMIHELKWQHEIDYSIKVHYVQSLAIETKAFTGPPAWNMEQQQTSRIQ